ncbi:hypothetical protein UFOVP1323_4 [uncultured Caudovirales phage]|uniref:Uncharacterized protein n=1 Tax=uncultured Caudovirales phage TaxID=2100421 RepID=A0A6J5RI83_9CAUD|nr:hypothetical protein UFOVP1323_4 [uncultured Caudovirales phage]
MNEAEILQILKNNGAPPTPENINRVMQQSGRGTELLGRSLGLQGGMDESGPGMDLMLNKLMKSTSTPAQMPVDHEVAPQAEAPRGRVEVGAPKVVARAPVQGRGIAPNTEPPPGTMPSANTAASSIPSTGSGNNPNVLDGSATRQMATQQQGEYKPAIDWDNLGIGNGLGWLAALLGLSAAAKPGAPPAAPMKQLTYEPKLTDQSGAKMPSGAPEMTNKDAQRTKGMAQTPEEIARLKAEVDAENAAIEASKPTEMGKSVKPKKTGAQETVDAVKQFRKLFAK